LGVVDAPPGTVSRRWANEASVPAYIGAMGEQEPIVVFQEDLTNETSMGETMMLGLRLLVEGVEHVRFRELHGADVRQVFADELDELVTARLIEVDDTRTRLTRSGLMVGNRVFERFVHAL
jgi:oxygen-independent coproporphyrinogen-3 oxidase